MFDGDGACGGQMSVAAVIPQDTLYLVFYMLSFAKSQIQRDYLKVVLETMTRNTNSCRSSHK